MLPPSHAADSGVSYVTRGTACVIGSMTTTVTTPAGKSSRTTTGCAITTVRGGERLVVRTGRAITAATGQAITTAGGWSKRHAVDVKRSIEVVWRRVVKKAAARGKEAAARGKALPKLPSMPKPKKLLVTISNKAINFRRKDKAAEADKNVDFGDGGLWQRTILMGDKCQPLDFSGVIYYDSDGRRVSDPPMKSPRRFPSNLTDTPSTPRRFDNETVLKENYF